MSRRLIPLFDRVLVRRVVAEAQSKGGVLLPETAQKAPNEGIVIATGTGYRKENGEMAPLTVQEGDKVLLPDFGGATINMNNEEFTMLRESDIIGILKE
eukprot:m.91530 g.91530  ORF g.91530 m.91530 type:complete len:99 (+) comp8873_c7_seq2:2293-2589(+)